jgi:hypothetical protein
MQSRKLGFAVAALAAAAAIASFVVLREDDSPSGGSTATTPAAQSPAGNRPQPGRGGGRGNARQPKASVQTIVVRGGQPVGGVQELAFVKGERIRFIVESDVADEVHLHGYDISKDVEAGGEVQFDVPASIEGVFEVELEQRVVPLAEVTVNP